jgi:hypothetical protein
MNENHKSRGQQLVFSNPSLLVMQRMMASGFVERVGMEHFFSCSHDAVNFCLGEMDVEALSSHGGPTESLDFQDEDSSPPSVAGSANNDKHGDVALVDNKNNLEIRPSETSDLPSSFGVCCSNGV